MIYFKMESENYRIYKEVKLNENKE